MEHSQYSEEKNDCHRGFSEHTIFSGARIFSGASGARIFSGASGARIFSGASGARIFSGASGARIFSGASGARIFSGARTLFRSNIGASNLWKPCILSDYKILLWEKTDDEDVYQITIIMSKQQAILLVSCLLHANLACKIHIMTHIQTCILDESCAWLANRATQPVVPG